MCVQGNRVPGRNADIQHPHLLILKQHHMVLRRRQRRVQVRRPLLPLHHAPQYRPARANDATLQQHPQPGDRMRVRSLAALVLFAATAVSAQKPYHPAKSSEILWDNYGVPHIYAKSTPDMFYLFGYAQAEAHGDLLLHVMAAARGRASEFYGPGDNDRNLKSDRWVLLNEVPDRAALWLSKQTPEFAKYLEAFAAGINAYATAHPDKLDPAGRRALPITPLDLIAHQQRFVNFEFVASQRLTESPATLKASEESPFTPTNPDMQDGSNGWALAPSHTASGHAMLLMNPHLAWAGEQSYFEVDLNAPSLHLYGATQIGLPVLRFSFSDDVAITNTVNTNNGALLYKLTEKDGGYVLDGQTKQYANAQHPFRILQQDGTFTTEIVQVQRTVQGPIIRRDNGQPIALYVAGLDKPFFLDQYWHMITAHHLADYQAQLRRLEVPMYNILYADREGHIEYLFNALVPTRTGTWETWQKPVDGSTSTTLPGPYLTYDQLPKQVDPPSGHIQNSNEPPWDAAWPTTLNPANYPSYISPSFPLFRSDRALRMLTETPKFTFNDLLQKKLSTRMEMADRLLPDLLTATEKYGTPRAKQAAAVLTTWDRQAEADSRGALLFYTWAQKFVSPSVSMIPDSARKNFATPYDINQPLTTPAGLANPQLAAQLLDEAAAETVKLYGALDTPWGQIMRLQLNSQSDGNVTGHRSPPLNAVDLPGNGGYGNLGIFRVVTYGPLQDGTKTPVHGDGFTLAVEFTTPVHAKSLVSYGDSSQPASPHHTDQLPLFRDKQWRDVYLTHTEAATHTEHRDTF